MKKMRVGVRAHLVAFCSQTMLSPVAHLELNQSLKKSTPCPIPLFGVFSCVQLVSDGFRVIAARFPIEKVFLSLKKSKTRKTQKVDFSWFLG